MSIWAERQADSRAAHHGESKRVPARLHVPDLDDSVPRRGKLLAIARQGDGVDIACRDRKGLLACTDIPEFDGAVVANGEDTIAVRSEEDAVPLTDAITATAA